jgi:hypothetical protein
MIFGSTPIAAPHARPVRLQHKVDLRDVEDLVIRSSVSIASVMIGATSPI